ncbi:MAG TPA: hypothetical protein VGD02_12775 [Gemmatimonadaceae bacterium]|jgi:hypothetical protein
MRLQRSVVAALMAGSTFACAVPKKPIEISADDFDASPLVGQWSGVYASPETGRTGTVDFTLRAGESAAFGEVVMVPNSAASASAGRSTSSSQGRTPLRINFIRKEGGGVVGTLDPYTDPECSCKVKTTFQGKFSDSATIEGTFATEAVAGGRSPTGGNWRVKRVKKL